LKLKVLRLISIFLILYSRIYAQTNNAFEFKELVTAKIIKGDVFSPQQFEMDLKNQKINADTCGHLSFGALKKSIVFENGFHAQKIHFFDAGNQIIMFFEVTDDETSFNAVYCINKQTLKTIWKNKLQSFNLTVGQAEKENLYLGAGEDCYDLDIMTGKILWHTAGLYFKYGFNYFDAIAIANNEIRLTGKSSSKRKKDEIKTAFLNKKDGRILMVR
jgi:hypothetical protein